MTHRVLVVDDHPPFRRAAAAMLRAGGFDVVGEAGDGEEALDCARRTLPDVVVLDIRLPGADGFAVAELLADLDLAPRVVLVSSRPAAEYGERIAAALVVGFLDKFELTAASLRQMLDTGEP